MTYLPNPQHRNKTKGKSQWLISLTEEAKCFHIAYANQWIGDDTGWGLHYPNGIPDYLGVAQDHETKVFIAKFVGN